MDLKAIPLFGHASTKLGYLTQRQEVLSRNIANSDTPDYVPRDLKPLDFRATMRQQYVRLANSKTNAQHLKGTLPTRPTFRSPNVDPNYETAPNGNRVIVEEQMMKVADTRTQFHTATQVYKKYSRMMKLALGRGGGR